MDEAKDSFDTRGQILQYLEEDCSDPSLSHRRADLFRQAAYRAASEGDLESAKGHWAEFLVFSLHAAEPDNGNGEYLRPMITIGPWGWPDPNSIPDVMLDYLEDRCERTSTPYLRARYADFLWQRGRGHAYARESVAAHLQLVKREADHGRYHNATRSARRALGLAFALGDRAVRESTIDAVTTAAEDWITNGSDDRFFATEIIDKILSAARFKDRSILKRWVNLLEKALRTPTEHHTRVELLSQLAKVLRRLGEPEGARLCQVRIGEEWEAEANERQPESSLVAGKFYQDALKAYAEAGLSDKVKEMKLKIRGAYRKAEDTEFKPISHRFELDMSDWDKQVGEWLKLEPADAVRHLAAYLPLIPSWQAAEAQTTRLEKDAPLSQLIPRVTVEDGRPVSQATSDEERRFENVRRQYNLLVIGTQLFLSRAIGKLRQGGALTGKSLTDAIRESPFFDEEKIRITQRGFERYAEGDYVSAIHILVPHLEDCLRRSLGQLGAEVTSVRAGKMREKALEEVLETEHMRIVLAKISDKLWRYFEHVLVAETGMNLRNRVAHGLLSYDQLDEGVANTVIHLCIILGLFRLQDDGTE